MESRESATVLAYLMLTAAVLTGCMIALAIQVFKVRMELVEMEERLDDSSTKSSPAPASCASSASIGDTDGQDMLEKGGLQIVTGEELFEPKPRRFGYPRLTQSDSAWMDQYFKPNLGLRRRQLASSSSLCSQGTETQQLLCK